MCCNMNISANQGILLNLDIYFDGHHLCYVWYDSSVVVCFTFRSFFNRVPIWNVDLLSGWFHYLILYFFNFFIHANQYLNSLYIFTYLGVQRSYKNELTVKFWASFQCIYICFWSFGLHGQRLQLWFACYQATANIHKEAGGFLNEALCFVTFLGRFFLFAFSEEVRL